MIKKVVTLLFLLFFSISSVSASGPLYSYVGDRCSDYAANYQVDSIPTNKSTEISKYRLPIQKILKENFDLNTKDDFKKFQLVQEKVISYIDSEKYSGKNKGVICAIHLELFVYEELYSNKLSTSKSLVEYTNSDDSIDLYIVGNDGYTEEKIYSKVEKFGEYISTNSYHQDNSLDYEKYEMQRQLQEEYGEYTELDTVHSAGEKNALSFINMRDTWPDNQNQRSWAGGIQVYENGQEIFSSYGKGLIHTAGGDIGSYKPLYLLDDNTMIVEGFRTIGILKNGADKTESIISE